MALGCTPMLLLMMNSTRARPTPALGSWAKSKASWGLPTFIMILVEISGIAPRCTSVTSVSIRPS
ncbi:hypothetical protein D3C78_1269260 [compost metagenome]